MKNKFRNAIAFMLALIMVISSVPMITMADIRYYALVGQGQGGDTVSYPSDGTADISFCEYTFSSDTPGSGRMYNTSSGRTVYFTIDVNDTSGCPGAATGEDLSFGINNGFVKKRVFYIKNRYAPRYMYFWDDNGTRKYRFDRQGSLSEYSQTYFALFTPDPGNTTSGIYGYRRVTAVSEITDGKKFLIAHASGYNDDGSLMSGGSWFVAYPSTSSNPYQHVAKVFNHTEDTSKKQAPVTAYGAVVKGGAENRASGTSLNIVNDGEDGNFDIGFVTFDISNINLSEYKITDATYTFNITVASGRENKGISLYYATQNTEAWTGKGVNVAGYSGIYGNGYASHKALAINHYGLRKLEEYNPPTASANVPYTVDLKDLIIQLRNSGKNTLTLAFMTTSAGQQSSNGGWTDTIVNIVNSSLPVSIEEGIEEKEYTETFGLVEYDPVIYTMGQDFLTVGDTIAHGSEHNERITNYTVKDGYTIESISSEVETDQISPSSKVGTGYLIGKVGGATETKSKSLIITTKLVDEVGNGYIQKDKLYVQSNPVPSHAVGGAYSWKFAFDTYYSDYVGFHLIAEGSYPAYNTATTYSGDACRKGNALKAGFTEAMYSTATFGDNYNESESFYETSVKAAGGFEFFKSNADSAIVRINTPKANYYLDKSAKKNEGITKTPTGTYNLQVTYLPQHTYDSGRNTLITASNISVKSNELATNANLTSSRYHNTGEKATFDIGIINTENGTHTATFAYKEEATTIPGAYLTIFIPLVVNIFDKSEIRDRFNAYVDKGLKSSYFTEESWNNFTTKMLNVEEYINRYNYCNPIEETNLLAELDDSFEDLRHAVTLNYIDGTVEEAEMGYLSRIPVRETKYDKLNDTQHNKTTYHWTPAIIDIDTTESTEGSDTVAENHIWAIEEVVTPSTCLEDGLKRYTCICGATKDEVIKSTGHQMGTMHDENYIPSTCISTGSYDKVVRCTVCNEILFMDSRTIAISGHTYVAVDKEDGVTHSNVCKVCGVSYDELHTFVDGACTGCSAIRLDLSAYNKAIEEYEAIISDEEYTLRYTEASRTSYEVFMRTEKSLDFYRQSEVDSAVSRILGAKDTLVYNTLAVNYSKYDEYGDLISFRIFSENYGFTVDLTADSNSKWLIKDENGGDIILNPSTAIFSTAIKDHLNIWSIANMAETADDKVKVFLCGKNDRVVNTVYVDSIDDLDLSEVKAPSVPFYESAGWSSPTQNIDGTYSVKALYVAK